MPEDFRVAVRSDPRLLSSVRGLVRTWIEEHGVAPEVTARVVLAIDEACANAIRHAYGGHTDEVVELVLRSAPEALEFVLSDRGSLCPKEKQRRRELAAPDPDDLCPGGLGIQLMHEVFDEVHFGTGQEGGNCVTMRLTRVRKEE
jgi:anti-sigma regulatory factor (Ser/Thr protein kinase)